MTGAPACRGWRRAQTPRVPRFQSRLDLDVPLEALWRYHANPGAFERLSPPWQKVELVQRTDGIGEGQRLVMKLGRRPFRITWEALHGPMVPLSSFEDTQVRGPFSRWHHVHAFEGDAARSSLTDTIDWAPPLPPLGNVGRCIVARQITRLFRFRHARTRLDLAHQTRTLPMDAQQTSHPLRIAITGSSGLVGQALIPYLTTAGHEVSKFVRRAPRDPGEIAWDPVRNVLDPSSLDGLDAIIHLAGDSIADGRWSPQKKALIRDSRVLGTKTLVDALARAERRPPVLVSASAIGFYGLGDEVHTERDGPGDDFLAGVCREWEDEATRAEALGVRVVKARLGVVLDPRGGALNKLVGPFKMGLGGKVGHGRQWMSWVALDDVVYALDHALRHKGLSGPINVVSPTPVTQSDFARTLGRVLARPSFMPLPGFAVKALFGEMGEALLLGGQRVLPEALLASGFEFAHPELEPALRMMLGR